MTQADSVHSTPPTNTSAPRPPTSQERADDLLRRYRLARVAGVPAAARDVLVADLDLHDDPQLDPFDVLVDLLGGADFDHEILDPEGAARIILERLRDMPGSRSSIATAFRTDDDPGDRAGDPVRLAGARRRVCADPDEA
jgi:hypothetical protein